MDMARVLIIKTPQKYKKTTHSARISHLFCVYFLRLFLMVGGMGGGGLSGMSGFSGMEENKKSASPKKNYGYGLQDSIVCIMGGVSLPVGGHLCVGVLFK